MTEQDYLTTTDPRALYDAFGERLTERQCEMFVRACRARWRTYYSGIGTPNVVRMWCTNDGLPGNPLRPADSDAECADIFRDICGNPFRRFSLCRYHPHQSCAEHQAEMRRLLTWQDATIPKLAAKCYEGEACRDCLGLGKRGCESCHGTGTITPPILDPLKLAYLADALEEAGCEDAGLLGHLRETERDAPKVCGGCQSYGFREPLPGCSGCKHSTLLRPIQHVRGCWAVELFLPRVTEDVR